MALQRSLRFCAGHLLPIGSVLLLLAAVVSGFSLPGCREQSTAPVDRNRPPETVLVGVPGDSTTSYYRQLLRWSGFDEDGTVVGYEWAITDSLPPSEAIEYRYTTRTDSIFIFSVDETREVLGHRFYVRAVDNEGKRDPTPAWTFFTVRNNAVPIAWFTLAEAFGPDGEVRPLNSTNPIEPTDTIPAGWGVRFAWTGSDGDRAVEEDGRAVVVGRIIGYDYKLGPLEGEPISVGARDTVRVYEPDRLRSDVYEMRVRARDDAGLSGNDPAVRSFVWNLDPVTRFSRDLVEGHADSVEVFYASTTGSLGDFRPYTRGDTLPLTASGVQVRALVRAFDPDPPHRILALEARLVRDATFWESITETGGLYEDPLPRFTGDYRLMARSQDGWFRWDGSPDTLVFHVNRRARFLDEWLSAGTIPRAQRPREGATYPVPTGTRDTLRIRFAASDADFALGAQQSLEFNYLFESYPVPGGGQGRDVLFSGAWRGGEISNPSDPGASPIDVTFGARRGDQNPFVAGDYVLAVYVRERYATQQNAQKYGYRENIRRVRFTLAPR